MVLAPVNLAIMIGSGALQGRLDFRAFNLARGGMAPLYALLLGLFAVTGHLTPKTTAIAYLLASAYLLAITGWLVARNGGLGHVNRALMRTMLRYGVVAHPGRLSAQHLGIDQVIVGIALSKDDLGVFATAVVLLSAPRLLTTGAGLVLFLFPTASSEHHAGRPARPPPVQRRVRRRGDSAADHAGRRDRARRDAVARRGDARLGEARAAQRRAGVRLGGLLVCVTVGSAIGGLHGAAVGVVLVNFLTAAALLGLAARAGVLRGILGRAHTVNEKQP